MPFLISNIILGIDGPIHKKNLMSAILPITINKVSCHKQLICKKISCSQLINTKYTEIGGFVCCGNSTKSNKCHQCYCVEVLKLLLC